MKNVTNKVSSKLILTPHEAIFRWPTVVSNHKMPRKEIFFHLFSLTKLHTLIKNGKVREINLINLLFRPLTRTNWFL